VVDAFNVAKLAVVPHSEVIVPETAEKIFEKRFVSTFRFVIDEVAATNEFVFKLVEVEFVIVPFATLIAGRERFVNERLVIVADVRVAFPPAIFAVVILAVSVLVVEAFVVEAEMFCELSVVALPVAKLEVVALVVEAFKTAKLPVVPNKVPMVADVKLAMAA
jgi:hypothetical protein